MLGANMQLCKSLQTPARGARRTHASPHLMLARAVHPGTELGAAAAELPLVQLQDMPAVARAQHDADAQPQHPVLEPHPAAARAPLFDGITISSSGTNGSSSAGGDGGGSSSNSSSPDWPRTHVDQVAAALGALDAAAFTSSSSSNSLGHPNGTVQQHQAQQQQEVPQLQQLLQQQAHLHEQQHWSALQQQPHQQPPALPQQQPQPQQEQPSPGALQDRPGKYKRYKQQVNQHALRTAQYYRDRTNRRLTARIRDANDLAELRAILRQYEGALNHIHAVTLFSRVAKLTHQKLLRPRDVLALPSMLPQVLSLVEAALPEFDERCISSALHSLALLELREERGLIAALLAAAERVRLASFPPQGLASLTWALASLRVNPGPRFCGQLLGCAAALLPRCRTHELAQLGWGLAVQQLRVDEAWLSRWRAAVLHAAQAASPPLRPQGLAMVLWATARLSQPQQQQQYSQHHAQIVPPLPQAPLAPAGPASSAGPSAVLPASSAAAAQPGAHAAAAGAAAGSEQQQQQQQLQWLQALEGVLQRQLPQHCPHSLSISLWAMSKLGYRPSAALLDAALTTLQPQLGAPGTTPPDLAVLLYSLAALGYRPTPAFMAAHGAALKRRLRGLRVRELANVLWSHGKLGLLPADEGLLPAMLEMLRYNMQDANARDLSNSLWALATLGVTPRHNFMGTFGAQAEAVVHEFTPQLVSNLLWAYAKLGLRPPHMLLVALWEGVGVDAIHTAGGSLGGPGGIGGPSGSSLGLAAGGGFGGEYGAGSGGYDGGSSSASARLSAFKPAELVMLVWALAVLKLAPGKAWCDQFLQSSFHKMTSQTPQSLANLIWSLSELQLQPPPAWLYHWAAATRGALGAMNPIDLGQVASALQGATFGPLGLPKLEGLLGEVLQALAAHEAAGGAYSKAAMGLLLRMRQQQQEQEQEQQQQQQQPGAAGQGGGSSGLVAASLHEQPPRRRHNGDGSSDSVAQELKQELLLTGSAAAGAAVADSSGSNMED